MISAVEGFAIAKVLNLLPMVEWDRFVATPDESGSRVEVIVYGWIRGCGAGDFVVIEFAPDWRRDGIGFVTSSDRFRDEISLRLYGENLLAAGWSRWQSVDDVFGQFVERTARVEEGAVSA